MQVSVVGASASVGRRPEAGRPREGTLRVAQMNIWNFFDTEQPGGIVLTPEQYAIKLGKTTAAIEKLGLPDIISFNEVENEGVLLDLAKSDALRGAGYQVSMLPTNDARGINVGIMYKGDKLEAVHSEQFNPKVTVPKDQGRGQIDPDLLYARAPLIVDFRLKGVQQAQDGAGMLTVAVNHFKSKIDRAGKGGPDERRALQGEHLGTYLDERATRRPAAATIVVGDLNANYGEPAVERLLKRADGSERFYDAPMKIAAKDRYTYVYRGRKDMLDHLMVSASKRDAIVGARILHVNTPNPYPHKDEPGTVPGFSDHDPMYVDFDVSKLVTA